MPHRLRKKHAEKKKAGSFALSKSEGTLREEKELSLKGPQHQYGVDEAQNKKDRKRQRL